jgi:hypothetical protein
MNEEPVNLVVFLAAILTYVTSREVASLLGPYAAIVVSASAGAAVSLSAIEKNMPQWWGPMLYIAVRVAVAVVLTVALAELAQLGWPNLRPRYLLIPIAFGIGLISDYNAFARSFTSALSKALPKWLANIGKRDG